MSTVGEKATTGPMAKGLLYGDAGDAVFQHL